MKHILIVDDETPIREWISACIRDYDSSRRVLTAASGQEALDCLRAEAIHIVFTDITMPKMDGITLLKHIRAEFPFVIVVIMSVHQEFHYARKALQLGAADYILKNEINKEGIFSLLDKITTNQNPLSQEENSLAPITRTKYLHQILLEPQTTPSIDDLRAHYIYLEDAPLFAMEMRDRAEAVAALRLHQREALANVCFFFYGYNKLLLCANLKGDEEQIPKLATEIRAALGGNVGYSALVCGLKDFKAAVKRANAMRDYLFYAPEDQAAQYMRPVGDEKALKVDCITRQNHIVDLFKGGRQEKTLEAFRQWVAFLKAEQPIDVFFILTTIVTTLQRIYNHSREMQIDIKGIEYALINCGSIARMEEILEEIYPKLVVDQKYSANIAAALAFISENYQNPISLSQVAEQIYLNDEYFSRLFKKEVGINFTDHLTALRMKEAKRLILTTDIKVANVGEMVGVANHKYFSLLFKKYFDETPSQLRETKHS